MTSNSLLNSKLVNNMVENSRLLNVIIYTKPLTI